MMTISIKIKGKNTNNLILWFITTIGDSYHIFTNKNKIFILFLFLFLPSKKPAFLITKGVNLQGCKYTHFVLLIIHL